MQFSSTGISQEWVLMGAFHLLIFSLFVVDSLNKEKLWQLQLVSLLRKALFPAHNANYLELQSCAEWLFFFSFHIHLPKQQFNHQPSD